MSETNKFIRKCDRCGKDYIARPHKLKKGIGKYCSKKCVDRSKPYYPNVIIWERINKTDNEDDCWLYTGNRDLNGYGDIWLGRDEKPRKTKAHRLVYKLTYGDIPEGMVIMHTCDNPPCCNPKHLKLGTNKDNCHDRINKGRNNYAYGEKAWGAKLTKEIVDEIRKVYSGKTSHIKDLIKIYNVSWGVIYGVVTWRTYNYGNKPIKNE